MTEINWRTKKYRARLRARLYRWLRSLPDGAAINSRFRPTGMHRRYFRRACRALGWAEERVRKGAPIWFTVNLRHDDLIGRRVDQLR